MERVSAPSGTSHDETEGIRETYAALRRVATLVAQGSEPELVFSTVVEEVALLLGAEFGLMRRYLPDRHVRGVALWSRSKRPFPPLGDEAVPLGGRNVSTLVFDTGQLARVDHYDADHGPAAAAAIAAETQSTVGAPIVVEGELWGVLLVSWTHAQPLPAETDLRLAGFAELVATAISNAEARAELVRVAEQQAALRRVATLVAQSAKPAEVFAAVAEELGNLVVGGAAIAVVARFEPDATATILAGAWYREPVVGMPRDLSGDDVLSTVYRTGESFRYDRAAAESDSAAEALDEHEIQSAVACPIIVNSRLWGATAVGSKSKGVRLPDQAQQRLVSFTELVATAIANAEDRAELTASRTRIVTAGDASRRRIERDLHDGIQQRLIRLALTLRTAERERPDSSEELGELVSNAAAELSEALTELQEISRGIHPPVLAQGGLAPALRTLGRRATLPVDIVAGTEERLPEQVEVASYYAAAEALANVAKHAKATRATITFEVIDDVLNLRVEDDGGGGADPRQGSGLTGLADRVQALGGSLEVDSPRGAGTRLLVRLPCIADRL